MVGKKGEAKKEADGKGKGGKGKGKDGKKGKKDVVSEVEETSDTELLKEESKEPEGAEEEEKEKWGRIGEEMDSVVALRPVSGEAPCPSLSRAALVTPVSSTLGTRAACRTARRTSMSLLV